MEEEISASETAPLDTGVDVIPMDEQASNVFCCAALANATEGTLYTDMTGSFPVQSLEGMHAFFVAYDYDTNMIFAIPTKNLKLFVEATSQQQNHEYSNNYSRSSNGIDRNVAIISTATNRGHDTSARTRFD